MGTYIKLRPKECSNCGYYASGSAFVKEFGRWFFGKAKCPVCGCKDILLSDRRASPPPKPPQQPC